MWREFYQAFEIPKYQDLPASQFEQALAFLNGERLVAQSRLQSSTPAIPEGMVLVPQHAVDCLLNSVEIIRIKWRKLSTFLASVIGYDLQGTLFDANECTLFALNAIEGMASPEMREKLARIRTREAQKAAEEAQAAQAAANKAAEASRGFLGRLLSATHR